VRYADVRRGQRVIFETDETRHVTEGTVDEVLRPAADQCVAVAMDTGGHYVTSADRLALLNVWDAIDPYQVSTRRPAWAGRASIVYEGGHTSEAELCEHQHTDWDAAWACARELAAQMNEEDGIGPAGRGTR
jgi:hypothetical protein